MNAGAFTREHLDCLIAEAVLIPKIPVGIVCKPHLRYELEQKQRDALASLPIDVVQGVAPSHLVIPIHTDCHQEANVLAFYDHTLLRLYLARHDSAEAMHEWVKAYVTSSTQTQVTPSR